MIEEGKINRRFFLRSLSGAFLGTLLYLHGGAALAGNSDDGLWDSLPEPEKEAIYERWQRFKAMSPEERAELKKAASEFEALTEAQKKKIEENFSRWKAFSPEEKQEIRNRYSRWQELPEHVKDALRENSARWDSLSDDERAKLLKHSSVKSAK